MYDPVGLVRPCLSFSFARTPAIDKRPADLSFVSGPFTAFVELEFVSLHHFSFVESSFLDSFAYYFVTMGCGVCFFPSSPFFRHLFSPFMLISFF